MKVAQALLLRKQLAEKVEQLRPLKVNGDNGLFESKVQRRKVSEEVDEVSIQVPKVTVADITRTFDHYATQLRKLDAAIQEANWKNEIEFTETEAPKAEEKAA